MTKQQLIASMRAANVVKVQIMYDGSGDEGFMQDVIYYSDEDHFTEAEDTLRAEWDTFHDRVLEAAGYDGYWNDSGGGGTITLDCVSGKLTIEHYWYETITNEDDPREVETQ